MRGKTISITLPVPIVEHYEQQAKDKGMSRSAVLVGIIMTDYDQKQQRIANVSTGNSQTENT